MLPHAQLFWNLRRLCGNTLCNRNRKRTGREPRLHTRKGSCIWVPWVRCVRVDRVKRPKPNDTWSDSDLLRCCRKGDEDAFLILYRRHQGPVFRFALHMSGNRDTAEEVTQEVFLAILAQADLYVADRNPLQAYLIGIARNQLRRQLKEARGRIDRVELDAGLRSGSGGHLIDELSRNQELTALRKAILSLPPAYREIVILCDLESIDYAAAASQLSCPVGTVRSRLHRARAILQAKLCGPERRQKSGGCVA